VQLPTSTLRSAWKKSLILDLDLHYLNSFDKNYISYFVKALTLLKVDS